ncbi:hypothetical protein T492DRAFT_875205, partial [Pavlovales sp. CCMP2436]
MRSECALLLVLACLASAALLLFGLAASSGVTLDISSSSSLYARYGHRGIVLVGEGCYVPIAFATATLLRQQVNLSVTLFTNQ